MILSTRKSYRLRKVISIRYGCSKRLRLHDQNRRSIQTPNADKPSKTSSNTKGDFTDVQRDVRSVRLFEGERVSSRTLCEYRWRCGEKRRPFCGLMNGHSALWTSASRNNYWKRSRINNGTSRNNCGNLHCYFSYQVLIR